MQYRQRAMIGAAILWLAFVTFAAWYLNRPAASAEDQGLKLWAGGLAVITVIWTAAALWSWLVSPI